MPISPRTHAELLRIATVTLVIVATGSGMAVLLAAGFRLAGDPMPGELAAVATPALLVFAGSLLVIALLMALRWWPRGAAGRFSDFAGIASLPRDAIADARHRRQQAERLERLMADPSTRSYAERMKRGEWWSDEQIAYDRDPRATVTCEHLVPIERAMRRAGIAVKRMGGASVRARCTIDASRLGLSPPARFAPDIPGERGVGPPEAVISCAEHASYIEVVHAGEAGPDTPVFPQA